VVEDKSCRGSLLFSVELHRIKLQCFHAVGWAAGRASGL